MTIKSHEELKALHGEAYVESFQHNSPWRLNRLLDYMDINAATRAVDYGCGNGMLMEFIAGRVHSYTGVDFSEAFIRAANAKKTALAIGNAEFVCADITEFGQQHAGSFDVAFAMDFSEHVYDGDWARILRGIRLSLKPGGKFYLHTPNADFVVEQMKSRNFILKQFPEHIAVRSPQHNAALLREAGFTVKQLWLVPHYNVLKLLHPLSYLPVIGKFFKARILIEGAA